MTHLDLDRLADLEEDLLTPEDAAAAQAHLRDCADCRDRAAQLRATRSLLSAMPAEVMPAVVSARVDAALAALPSTTIVPLGSRRRGWRAHPTAAGLGAAAAVAALVAALVVGRTSSHPSSTDTADGESAGTAAAPRATLALPSTSASGTRYTVTNLTRKVGALLAPPDVSSLSAASPANPGTAAAPQPTATSAAGANTHIPASLQRLYGSPGDLAACVIGLEEQSQIPIAEPLAIDFGRFRTPAGVQPAVVIVLPGIDDPGTYGAWVVGPGCTRSDVDLLDYAAVSAPPSSPSPSASP